MVQITLDIDEETLAKLNAAANAAGISQSEWIIDAVRSRIGEWSEIVRSLAGTWPEAPFAEELRSRYGVDGKREPL